MTCGSAPRPEDRGVDVAYGSGMAQHEPVPRIEALCWRMGGKVPTSDYRVAALCGFTGR
jgi:hypothetical protein